MNNPDKLNPKIKTRWLAELRSDKHKQAQHVLFDEKTGGLCCIGVLGKMLGATEDELHRHRHSIFFDGMSVKYCDPRNFGSATRKHLAAMNDSGKSFAEIADWIEQNL